MANQKTLKALWSKARQIPDVVVAQIFEAVKPALTAEHQSHLIGLDLEIAETIKDATAQAALVCTVQSYVDTRELTAYADPTYLTNPGLRFIRNYVLSENLYNPVSFCREKLWDATEIKPEILMNRIQQLEFVGVGYFYGC